MQKERERRRAAEEGVEEALGRAAQERSELAEARRELKRDTREEMERLRGRISQLEAEVRLPVTVATAAERAAKVCLPVV